MHYNDGRPPEILHVHHGRGHSIGPDSKTRQYRITVIDRAGNQVEIGSVMGPAPYNGWWAGTGDKNTSLDGLHSRRKAIEYLLRVAGYSRDAPMKGVRSEQLDHLRILAQLNLDKEFSDGHQLTPEAWVAHIEQAGGRLPDDYFTKRTANP